MNDPILEQYKSYWSDYSSVNDFSACSKVLRAMLHFFGNDPARSDLIEQMADYLEMRYVFMELEDFTSCAKAVTYARRKISAARGTKYASGLSRQLSDSELAVLRGAGAQDRGPWLEGNGNGDESILGFVGDLRADGDDSD